MNSEPAVIMVVDDDQAVRTGLSRLLRSAGYRVETFASAQEFLSRPGAVGHGCLILDLQMPAVNGLELQRQLAAKGVHTPIIFLTGHGDIPIAVDALKKGAVDFLTKPYRAQQLLKAVEAALAKDGAQREFLAERDKVHQRFASLTAREQEVLALVVQGLLNKQIAAELGNSERTVKVHRARVMQKMKVESVAELTRMVERSGLKLPNSPSNSMTPQPVRMG